MPKLTKMERVDLQCLLEAHSEICDAAAKIGKRGIVASIATTNNYDDKDYLSVTIDGALAKQALSQQRAKVEKALAKYGVTMK